MAALELLPGSPAGQPPLDQEPQPWGAEGRQVLQAVADALVHMRRPASRLLEGVDFPRVRTAEWGRMNRKRAELIRKKIREELSEEERELLETLQRRSLEELERAFPRGGGNEGGEEAGEAQEG